MAEKIDDAKYLGLDIGGSNLKYGIVNARGNVVMQAGVSTKMSKGRDYVLGTVSGIIEQMKRKNQLAGIGIGIGGIVDHGIIHQSPNLPGWTEVNFADILAPCGVPVFVENDANIAALFEMKQGICSDSENFIFVNLGTSVSSAIVMNGKIWHGMHGGAGNLGHIVLDMNEIIPEKVPAWKSGVLENYVGKNNIAHNAAGILRHFPNSILRKYDKLDPYFISMGVGQGDKCAIKIFRNVGIAIGTGIATMMNLLDIPLVVFGGGLAMAHQILFQVAMNTVRERTLPVIARDVEFRYSRNTKDAGVIGAAMMAKAGVENDYRE